MTEDHETHVPPSIARFALSPVGWFNRWTKKRGVDRQALVRQGSAVVTPAIELAKTVGPGAVAFGTQEEIAQRFRTWLEEWERVRVSLLTFTNAHPSEKVKRLGQELVPAINAAFSSTRYLSFWHRDNTMETFREAESNQSAAVALAESLLEEIRRF